MIFLRSSIYCLIIVLYIVGIARADKISCGKAKSSIEQAICQNDELQKIDAALNAVYVKILNERDELGEPHIGESKIALFKSQQRNWLVRRDAQCGSLKEAAINNCLQVETEKRTLSLSRNWLEPSCAEMERLRLDFKP